MIEYSGKSDIGCNRTLNEDYVNMVKFNDDDYLAIIVDGAGSLNVELQPAFIVGNEVIDIVRRILTEDYNSFCDNICLFLKEALLVSNRVFAALQMGNEELYGGFRASATIVFLHKKNIYMAHTGNTRAYIMRQNNKGIQFLQISHDFTKYQKLVDEYKIQPNSRQITPEHMMIIGAIGTQAEPQIQTTELEMNRNDIILLTTDGIHYCLTQNDIQNFILKSDTCDDIAKTLIETAKSLNYSDNMSAIAIWNNE